MSENCQSAPFSGTECALQPSVPVLRNATPSAGSVCNFYGVCTPAVSSAWLLPSDSSTRCQQLKDSACLDQRAGTTMPTKPTDQNQISTSTFFYPSVLHWDLRESTTRREAPFLDAPLTVIDQNTTPSSRSITAQCDNTFHINALPPSYPTLSACLVQATPSNGSDQRYILAPCYLDESQVYYNDQNILGPPVAEEFWQCQQAYGSVSCSGNQTSSLHPEMVMALQEIQPMNIQTPFSTAPIYWPTSAQAMPDTSLQVVERETTRGLTPSGQALCLLQNPDLSDACTQDAQMKTAPVSGNRLLTALMHSPSEFLALPPTPSLEKTQKNNADETNAEQSTPLDSYEGTKCNQDASPLPLAHPGTQQPLNYSDVGSLRQKLASQNATLGNSGLGLEEPEALQSVVESSNDFTDMTTLVADIHLPQLFNSLTELNLFQDPRAAQCKDSTVIGRDQARESSSVISALSDQVRKNDQKVSELPDEALQARVQLQKLVEGEEAVGSAGISEGAFDNMAKHLEGKAQKVTPSKRSRARAHGQDKAKKTRENNSKKTEKLKPSNHRVKAEEKPAIPKTKRKRNPPELSHDSFKKPRTQLGMHMLASVQVFHPLLLDFSCQRIPWRKVDIPGPVISQPITEEQRPEREAMKRRAQQERENAAKCTSLGKPQLFKSLTSSLTLFQWWRRGYPWD